MQAFDDKTVSSAVYIELADDFDQASHNRQVYQPESHSISGRLSTLISCSFAVKAGLPLSDRSAILDGAHGDKALAYSVPQPQKLPFL